MDYVRIYNNIISNAKMENRKKLRKTDAEYVYYELHHVIPKCLGGTDKIDNLVLLHPEEHFLAHQLLVKIYPSNRKLVYALSAMCMSSKSHSRNNKMYGWIKRANISARMGIIQSVESNEKRRQKLEGRKTSTGMSGNSHRKESKDKISESQLGLMKDSPRTTYAWLRSPNSEEILFGPLLNECKKYNLVLEYVSNMCKGKKQSYKGWVFTRLASSEEKDQKILQLRKEGLMI